MAKAEHPRKHKEPLEVIEATERGEDPDAPDVWVFVGDERWPWRPEMVTGVTAARFRSVARMGIKAFLNEALDWIPPDPDMMVLLVWLARMTNGEPDLGLDEVDASGITLQSGAEGFYGVTKGSDFEEDPDSPEA